MYTLCTDFSVVYDYCIHVIWNNTTKHCICVLFLSHTAVCAPLVTVVFLNRRENLIHGHQASKILHPVEPSEPFKPFEPVRTESADAASNCSNSGKSNIIQDITLQISTPTVASSPARSSTLLSSLSSPPFKGTSERDKKENPETLQTHDPIVPSSLKGSPQIGGGRRGAIVGKGFGGRPSPASRLSFVDRNWLERCQVFGEMEAEERPGAGNHEVRVEKGAERKEGGEKGKEICENRERTCSLSREGNKTGESITGGKILSDIAVKLVQHGIGKAKGAREDKERKMVDEQVDVGPPSLKTPEDSTEKNPKTKAFNKRGAKRQREKDGTEADATEDGGVKKRRRNTKKKESFDVNHSPASGGGGKKRRAKKKEEEDGEWEEVKEAKEPKKVRRINAHLRP